MGSAAPGRLSVVDPRGTPEDNGTFTADVSGLAHGQGLWAAARVTGATLESGDVASGASTTDAPFAMSIVNAPLVARVTLGAAPLCARTTASCQPGTITVHGSPARLSIRTHALRPPSRTPLTRNAPFARRWSNDASRHAAGIA